MAKATTAEPTEIDEKSGDAPLIDLNDADIKKMLSPREEARVYHC